MNPRVLAAAIGGAAIGLVITGTVLLTDHHHDTTVSAAPAPSDTTPTTTGTGTTITSRTITVTGTGTVNAKPDTANVNLGVQATAGTATQALRQANEAGDALLAALKKAGVNADDIVTTGLYVYPQYTGSNIITGYQASNQVNVTVKDITKTGPVIDAAAAAAGNHITISGVSFSIADPETVLATARANAMHNAQARAGQYAQSAGAKVGQVLTISEISATPAPVYYDMASAGAAKGASTPISTGTQDLSVTVTVVFALT